MNTTQRDYLAKKPPHRRRRQVVTSPPGPVGLNLVAASYEETAWVQLTFDRAINAAALVGSEIIIDDAGSGLRYRGLNTSTMIDPQTVRIEVTEVGASGTADTLLTAGGGTGIVATDDGEPWDGVSDVELPFP